jgi:glucose/arabinose dehydrogenase
MLFAEITKPGFNGAIEYVESGTSITNNDQRDGQIVDVIDGVDVSVYAHGIRNAFDLVYTTEYRIYATDNGPNATFGPTSTGPDTEGPEADSDDDFLVIKEGH